MHPSISAQQQAELCGAPVAGPSHRCQRGPARSRAASSSMAARLQPRAQHSRWAMSLAVSAARPPQAAETTGRDLDLPAVGFDSIPDALEAIRAGQAVVVLDDEDRENEGDLILAADRISEAAMAFMVEHTSGVVCIGMEGPVLDRLRLPLMVSSAENEESMYTAFTITADLREGTTTGISAADRAATLRALADPSRQPEDFRRPGHVFPLRYRQGGVLRRPGHTEASVDLARLAGCHPAGVLCEIVNRDGTMARTPQLLEFARRHSLKVITIADLIRYRLKHDRLVECTLVTPLPTRHGLFTAHAYRSLLDGTDHLALVAGRVHHVEGVLTRIHSESMLGDIFGSQRCDTGSQLDAALAAMAERGSGVLVYLRRQQGRGVGLSEELEAYSRSDPAACEPSAAVEDSASPVDARDYGVAADILRDLGVQSVRLLTRNPAKANGVKAHGIKVLECLPGPPHASGSSSSDGAGKAAHAAGDRGSGKARPQPPHLPSRSRNGAEPHFV